MSTIAKHWCGVRKEHVTEGTCNVCNRFYLDRGIYPFLACVNGHCFRPEEAIADSNAAYCPTCRKILNISPPQQGGFCCDYVDCKRLCDWYGHPDHCNLARDPADARRELEMEYTVADPVSGKTYTIEKDGYETSIHQRDNLAAKNITDEELSAMGVEISKSMAKIKFMHQGNADIICGEIQDEYNHVVRDKYPQAKVIVGFLMKKGKPAIDISAGNSVTSWLLHELRAHVCFKDEDDVKF